MTTIFDLAECNVGNEVDTREKYRHKGIGRKLQTRHYDRPFISFDIETYCDDAGIAHVMLAGFSTGEIITGESITSKQIMELIRSVALKYPSGGKDRPIFIGFVIKYEKEFILRDMGDEISGDIHRSKKRHDDGIRYEYINGKYLQLSSKIGTAWSMRIYDTFSWFNAKLVNAAEAHLKTDSNWLNLKHLVVSGKDSRNKFAYSDLAEVFKYWDAEQKVLIHLMNHIRKLIIKADIPVPKSWFGPSALATECLGKYKIKSHLNRELPDAFVLACRYAYYGGHIEQYKAGTYDGAVYQYDINSAYPSGMTSLWSWEDSKLLFHDSVDRSLPCDRYALYHVAYNSTNPDAKTMPHPFPHRTAQGKVYYPPANETWIWGAELENDWNNVDVTIISAWVVTPGITRPFSWIQDLYDQRLQYKRDNDPAEYIVKITLNSLYGKLAQRVGSVIDENGNVVIPTFHELAWAGYTTAHCRGMIRETVVNQSIPGSIFQIETDCVMSTAPLNVPISKMLGEWDYKISTGITTLQNGFYFLRDVDGNYNKPKTRGLVRNSVNGGIEAATTYLEQLNLLGKENTPPMVSTVHGFYGQACRAYHADLNKGGKKLTYGLAKTNDNYMKWTDSTRETEFVGNGKRVWDGCGNPAANLVVLENGWNSLVNPDSCSSPHNLPWADVYFTGDEVQEYNLFCELNEFVILDEI